MLRPGDPVEQLVLRTLIERADDDRVEDLVALARGAGVSAGQVVALCLGVDPKWVAEVASHVLGIEEVADAR